MKTISVRKATEKDIDEIVEIWYKSSVVAHDFIPESYWQKNKKAMRTEYLPNSEIYISMDDNMITGFVALIDDYLAALFVLPDFQREGIGSMLLKRAKNQRNKLRLSVYKKNANSVKFYKSKEFSIVLESIDQATGEDELLMEWISSNKSN